METAMVEGWKACIKERLPLEVDPFTCSGARAVYRMCWFRAMAPQGHADRGLAVGVGPLKCFGTYQCRSHPRMPPWSLPDMERRCQGGSERPKNYSDMPSYLAAGLKAAGRLPTTQ